MQHTKRDVYKDIPEKILKLIRSSNPEDILLGLELCIPMIGRDGVDYVLLDLFYNFYRGDFRGKWVKTLYPYYVKNRAQMALEAR